MSIVSLIFLYWGNKDLISLLSFSEASSSSQIICDLISLLSFPDTGSSSNNMCFFLFFSREIRIVFSFFSGKHPANQMISVRS